MKRALAVFLATVFIFYGSPLLAEGSEKHFFNIGARPVAPDREIDWSTECRVELTEPSPTIRISFLKNGEVGETRPGNIRSGYIVVVDRATGFAKWISLCGNDVVEPKNWVPVGKKECRNGASEAAPAPTPTPAPEKISPPEPAPVEAATASPSPTPTPTPAPDLKKKGNGTWKWIGGILIGGAVAVVACALTKNCDFGRHSSGGGPSPDPPNGPSGGPPN